MLLVCVVVGGSCCSLFFLGLLMFFFVFFFFKQKTAYEIYQCDWSSDVCSSDLRSAHGPDLRHELRAVAVPDLRCGRGLVRLDDFVDRKSVV